MLLSICIPSYNRFEHLMEILKSIDRCDNKEYEVVVIDNGSKSDINEVIKKSDYNMRLRVIKRKQIVSGITNPRDCINYGIGKYRLLLLDKDQIIGEELDEFLAFLSNHQNLLAGRCKLNTTKKTDNYIYSRKDFTRNAFKIIHPSGTFIREDVLVEDNRALDYLNPKSIYLNFPYIYDLSIARCMLHGTVVAYNAPLVTTESEDDAKQTKTYSYNEKNLFFTPSNKRKQMNIYFINLNSYPLTRREYFAVTIRIIKRIMYDSSIGYASLMRNEKICEHYGVAPRIIRQDEMIGELRETSKFIEGLAECKVNRCIKQLITKIVYTYLFVKIKWNHKEGKK